MKNALGLSGKIIGPSGIGCICMAGALLAVSVCVRCVKQFIEMYGWMFFAR